MTRKTPGRYYKETLIFANHMPLKYRNKFYEKLTLLYTHSKGQWQDSVERLSKKNKEFLELKKQHSELKQRAKLLGMKV